MVPRVEAGVCGLDLQDVDVRREFVVQRPPQFFGFELDRDVEVGDLAQRMNTCVGSPRAVEFEIGPSR